MTQELDLDRARVDADYGVPISSTERPNTAIFNRLT
jgi:hypothetical protein